MTGVCTPTTTTSRHIVSPRVILTHKAFPVLFMFRFPPILIFPEGTTTNGQCLIEFKRGAFVPGVTVQPIILRYPCSHYNPADTGRHAGNVGLFWLMLQFANWIEVKELEPYSPTQAERDDPLLFARNVQSMMAAAAKVPTTDHSFVGLALGSFLPAPLTCWLL